MPSSVECHPWVAGFLQLYAARRLSLGGNPPWPEFLIRRFTPAGFHPVPYFELRLESARGSKNSNQHAYYSVV